MPSRELVKLYYRIGEVSEIVGVQPHVLRYWETEFRSIRPQKSSKGQRVYSRRDVEKLLRVKDLLRNQGFTIAGARKRLSDAPEAAALVVPVPVSAVAIAPPDPPSEQSAERMISSKGLASASAAGHAAADHNAAEPNAKDMRRALLGLRQDLMRMLDELSAIQSQQRESRQG